MSIAKKVQHLMRLRAEVQAQHRELMQIFSGACPEKEAIIAQYVTAAVMLEVSDAIDRIGTDETGDES